MRYALLEVAFAKLDVDNAILDQYEVLIDNR